MKKIIIICVGLALVFGILYQLPVLAQEKQDKTAPEESKEVTLQDKIKSLIKDLGANEAKVRENATKELKDIGAPAIPALKEALNNDDPEVCWRARIILRSIERARQSEDSEKEDKVQILPKKTPNVTNRNSMNIIIQGSEPYQSFSLQQDTSGKVKVTIKKKTNEGTEKTETYEANSMEEFIKKYPDVAKQYGLQEPGKHEIPEMNPDDLLEDFGESWGKEFERIQKQMREMEERMKRLFEGKEEDDFNIPKIVPKRLPKETPNQTSELGMMVSLIEPALKEQLKLSDENGILVEEVKKDSLAEKIGFVKWDVVLNVNDEPVKSIWEFKRLMKEALGKDELQVFIIRKGEKQVLKYKK